MDVFRSALSLVIHKHGNVDDADIDDLLDFYRSKKGINIDRSFFTAKVDAALSHYESKDRCLFVCSDGPCLERTSLNLSRSGIHSLQSSLDCEVELTGCHWLCDQAPSVTWKTGSRSESFVRCHEEDLKQIVRVVG